MSLFPTTALPPTEAILAYQFRDKSLLASALNASGSTHILHGARVGPNKRLSLYGDTLMTALLCTKWYARADLAQSDWTEIRASVLGIKNLGHVGAEAGLAEMVVKQAGTPGVSAGMMAGVVQALMGAVHLDAGGYAQGVQKMGEVMRRIGIVSVLLPEDEEESGGAAAAVGGGGDEESQMQASS